MSENTDRRLARTRVLPGSARASSPKNVPVVAQHARPEAPGAIAGSAHLTPARNTPSGERRAHARRTLNLAVSLRVDDREITATCLNAGGAGGLLRCRERLAAGTRLALRARVSGAILGEVCLVACVGAAERGSAAEDGWLFAVEWLSATSVGGARVLTSFLTNKLQLDVESSQVTSIGGFAVYRFAAPTLPKIPSGCRNSDAVRARSQARSSSPSVAVADVARASPVHPIAVTPASENTEPSNRPAVWRDTDSEPWPADVPEELSNRYNDLRRLGSGGYGVVYEAWDTLLDRAVALKFMHPSLDGEDFRRQFLREVRITVGLAHPHIVRIYDAGKVNETLYFAMESIAGRTLTEYLRPSGADLPFTVNVIAQLASALDYVHGRGVVHLDVKPDNVLVERGGSVQLFDFGLSRSRTDRRGERSVILGTPQYMAPEQPYTRELDGRCDQYSLAVVAYELLAGRLPFVTGNLFVAHALEPVPDPRLWRPDLPGACTAVLLRGMAKKGNERFGSCAELADALAVSLGFVRVKPAS